MLRERFAVPLAGLYPSVVPLPRYPWFGRRSGFAFQRHVFSKGGDDPHGIVDKDRGGRCGTGAHIQNIFSYIKEKKNRGHFNHVSVVASRLDGRFDKLFFFERDEKYPVFNTFFWTTCHQKEKINNLQIQKPV